MTNFKNSLDKLGLILAPVLIKILGLMYKQAESSGMIPCALLKGLPGAGKTSTADEEDNRDTSESSRLT